MDNEEILRQLEFMCSAQITKEQGKTDIICHLAAKAGVRQSLKDPMEYVSVDIGGTVSMLEYAKAHEVERFVFACSSSV